ncbi:unnamed protein product [Blepharisma stoltei]|uniref:Uncharacterized protein n=1 Tax=Blepharisma stoltei TaxID=1481888 RepID=A0AAU9ITU2_9CILI|nr:unnamed protein product [Blepharisma stoltei]
MYMLTVFIGKWTQKKFLDMFNELIELKEIFNNKRILLLNIWIKDSNNIEYEWVLKIEEFLHSYSDCI